MSTKVIAMWPLVLVAMALAMAVILAGVLACLPGALVLMLTQLPWFPKCFREGVRHMWKANPYFVTAWPLTLPLGLCMLPFFLVLYFCLGLREIGD
jgi:hypothetical protein|eukprot:SAG25_NODE_786_length_5332_cov_175.941525_10_plen_96_part_00